MGYFDVKLERLTFCDGTSVQVASDDILVITGPNNSGKTQTLVDLNGALQSPRQERRMLSHATVKAFGSKADFKEFIADRYGIEIPAEEERFETPIGNYDPRLIDNHIAQAFVGHTYLRAFYVFLDTASRLGANLIGNRIADPRIHTNDSFQLMERYPRLEEIFSDIFRDVFGYDLLLSKYLGTQLHLLLCEDLASLPQIADRYTGEFAGWLERQPRLNEQGSGMKSFAQIMLATVINPKSVISIDEPEAFLHPPQIVKLAELLAHRGGKESQILLATHSEILIQALLNFGEARIKVIRLTRGRDGAKVKVLNNSDVSLLWRDPILRYSNLLSAVVHDTAILCEADGDCTFYQAILDVLSPPAGYRAPDSRFYHCNGKGKMPAVAAALRAIGVPIKVIADIDVLDNKSAFRRLFEALGGSWSNEMDVDLDVVAQQVASRRGELTGSETRSKIEHELDGAESEAVFSERRAERIKSILRSASAWLAVKRIGATFFSGGAYAAFDRISERSRSVGLYVNREGELESFYRSQSPENKRVWLNAVLKLDFKNSKELEGARSFVQEILNDIAIQ